MWFTSSSSSSSKPPRSLNHPHRGTLSKHNTSRNGTISHGNGTSSSSSKCGCGHNRGSGGCCRTCFLVLVTAVLAFYLGLMVGTASTTFNDETSSMEAEIQRRVREQVGSDNTDNAAFAATTTAELLNEAKSRFPLGVRDFALGMGLVDRDDFAAHFNLGVPLDPSARQNSNVLLLYQQPMSLPSNTKIAHEAMSSTTPIPVIHSIDEAVANCDYLNLILTDFSPKRRQCTALMGQYEAFHIQKFMRLPEEGAEEGRRLNPTLPLRFVNRGAQINGRKSTNPPTEEQTTAYWVVLQRYLASFDAVLADLKPKLEQVVVDNTMVVLVCNFGQSELLANFACAARHRGLDLSHILVFATDEETRDLATGLGLTAFYDAVNYGDMPQRAAGRYADKTFMKMMMAKVFCVHMVAWLGYDILFQDVDVIWYKNPIPYFHDANAVDKDFDMYFQDEYVLSSNVSPVLFIPCSRSHISRLLLGQRQSCLVLCTVLGQYRILLCTGQ
jgi:Nucleotide-diphospho-sugar transferase